MSKTVNVHIKSVSVHCADRITHIVKWSMDLVGRFESNEFHSKRMSMEHIVPRTEMTGKNCIVYTIVLKRVWRFSHHFRKSASTGIAKIILTFFFVQLVKYGFTLFADTANCVRLCICVAHVCRLIIGSV